MHQVLLETALRTSFLGGVAARVAALAAPGRALQRLAAEQHYSEGTYMEKPQRAAQQDAREAEPAE